MDIMYVNGIPFLTTINRIVRFGSSTEMIGANMNNAVIVLKVVSATYKARGFIIVTVTVDNGFSALKHNPDFIELKITLNLIAEDEYEPYIERFNRTIKEKCRLGIPGVPFTKLSKRMVAKLVYDMIFWYNFTIPENCTSNILGPGAIILDRTYNYNMLCGQGSKFREYMQTITRKTNTMHARTVSAICLRSSGNTQGSFYYYSL